MCDVFIDHDHPFLDRMVDGKQQTSCPAAAGDLQDVGIVGVDHHGV